MAKRPELWGSVYYIRKDKEPLHCLTLTADGKVINHISKEEKDEIVDKVNKNIARSYSYVLKQKEIGE